MTTEDFRVAELAMKTGCATLIALNKWDIQDTDLDFVKGRVSQKLRLRPEVLTVSAKSGRGITRLLRRAIVLADRASERIPTPALNRFLADVQALRDPPAIRGRRLKMYYMAQYDTRPPRFAIQVSDRSRVTRDYAYFIENRLRERWGLEGVPLVIDFKGRDAGRSPEEGRGRSRGS